MKRLINFNQKNVFSLEKRRHGLLVQMLAIALPLLFFSSLIFYASPALSHIRSEYNADKVIPFSGSVYEINPQTGTMAISVQDLVLKGRAGHDLVIGRVYTNVLANAYNMGLLNGYPLKIASTHLDQKYGLGCGWGLTFPSIDINLWVKLGTGNWGNWGNWGQLGKLGTGSYF